MTKNAASELNAANSNIFSIFRCYLRQLIKFGCISQTIVINKLITTDLKSSLRVSNYLVNFKQLKSGKLSKLILKSLYFAKNWFSQKCVSLFL